MAEHGDQERNEQTQPQPQDAQLSGGGFGMRNGYTVFAANPDRWSPLLRVSGLGTRFLTGDIPSITAWLSVFAVAMLTVIVMACGTVDETERGNASSAAAEPTVDAPAQSTRRSPESARTERRVDAVPESTVGQETPEPSAEDATTDQKPTAANAGELSRNNTTNGKPTETEDPTSLATDRAALVALYHATNGDDWYTKINWLSDEPIEAWWGVRINSSGRVAKLFLAQNGLNGKLPPELGDLSHLEFLTFHGNFLIGELPPELGNLGRLGELDLSANQFSGGLPPSLSDLPQLQKLDLSGNQLSGAIPTGFAKLDYMVAKPNFTRNKELCVPVNDEPVLSMLREDLDSGALSYCIGAGSVGADREALVALYRATDGDNWIANDNWLSDAPLNWWHGVDTNDEGRVIHLALPDNQLTGTIPAELENLSLLRGLGLANNQLSGAIPSELGNLTNLRHMGLMNNGLSGELPSELGQLPHLTDLILAGNQFSGGIPSRLGNLSQLRTLNLSQNQLSGEIPSELANLRPDEETHHAGLQTLDLSFNRLSGQIPPELGDLGLSHLDLSDNQLSGGLPPELGQLTRLGQLDLSNNQLTGPFPLELMEYGFRGGHGTLARFDVSNNGLSGDIPPELRHLGVEFLDLSNNQLSGWIPQQLRDAHLKRIDLSGNPLSGCVPPDLMSKVTADLEECQ